MTRRLSPPAALAACTLALPALLSACASGPALSPPSAARACAVAGAAQDQERTLGETPTLGCVNAANLAAMADDPRDLQQGRPLGATSGARAALGVEAYDRGQIKTPSSSQEPAKAVPVLPSAGTSSGNP